jgi:hypothetical protein
MNRTQQVISLLLSTMPVAERMLLVQLATTAWIMVATRLPALSSF